MGSPSSDKPPMSQEQRLQRRKRVRAAAAFVVMLVMLAVLVCLAANTGTLKADPAKLVNGLFFEYDQDVSAIFDLRFPRIVIALFAGAAIAVSGVLFQSVLKNPLADPGIIGISSGASFAAALVVAFLPNLYLATPAFACLGGFVSFGLVYALSWKEGLSPLRVILVGIAVSALFTGLSDALGSVSSSSSSVASIVEGNIAMKTWDDVATLVPYAAAGLVLSLFCIRTCNLLQLEDRTARSLGVNVNRSRLLVSCVAVLLASISTAVVGPISFLGLIVPHIGRILVGSDHGRLVPFCIILGAFVMLCADTIGRTIAAPYEISAAIIMSVIGGPFFIFLLRRSSKHV